MKKFDWKLTTALVSLFLSLGLFVLAGKLKICLSFGAILLGFAIFMLAFSRIDKIESAKKEITNELNNLSPEDTVENAQLRALLKKCQKDRISTLILFSICAFVLVLCGIILLFK